MDYLKNCSNLLPPPRLEGALIKGPCCRDNLDLPTSFRWSMVISCFACLEYWLLEMLCLLLISIPVTSLKTGWWKLASVSRTQVNTQNARFLSLGCSCALSVHIPSISLFDPPWPRIHPAQAQPCNSISFSGDPCLARRHLVAPLSDCKSPEKSIKWVRMRTSWIDRMKEIKWGIKRDKFLLLRNGP